MALQSRWSTGLRNAMLDPGAADDTLDAFNGGTLKMYDGTQPANADAAPAGTLLLTITLPTPAFGAVSAGARAKAGVWSGNVAAASTATWFRIATSADGGGSSATDKRIDGSVGTASADIVLGSAVLAVSDVVTIDSYSASLPASV